MSRPLLAVLLGAAAVAGCSRTEEQRNVAVNLPDPAEVQRGLAEVEPLAAVAVTTFRTQYESERFAEIYQAGTPGFRAIGTEAQFIAFMRDLRQRLGSLRNTERIGVLLSEGELPGRVLKLTYNSRFERGIAQEELFYRIADGRATLARYNVRSPQLADPGGVSPAALPPSAGIGSEAAR